MHVTRTFVERWIFKSVAPAPSSDLLRQTLTVVGLGTALTAALGINKLVVDYAPNLWMALMLMLAFGMARMRYAPGSSSILQLWKSLGALSALYGLLHYPLMPALDVASAHWLYSALIVIWIVSIGCGLACFRFPSLALVPPAYLLWSKLITHDITGLRHRHVLDVAPLPEVSVCIALGLVMLGFWRGRRKVPERASGIDIANEFEKIIPVLAICIHLANYFWSFVAKLTLHGPFLSWIWLNNPINIYLAASDDGHIIFADWALASRAVGTFIDKTHIPSNIFVFFAQMIAVFGFTLPKRGLILLLIAFDFMHVAIALAAGANFWPWIFLNLAIAAVVARDDFPHPRPLVGLGAAAFIVISPIVANVALLGWYDAPANNNAYLLVETKSGERVPVSSNFYTFYSYPISHMRYGMPEPDTAFTVGNPNGGTRDYWVVEAARRCDADALITPGSVRKLPQPEFSNFIINYHNMAQDVRQTVGFFPFDYYPHHFLVLPSRNKAFEKLDLNDVRAYIYRRESVCLSYVDGQVRRKVVTTGELRIDLPQGR